VNASFVEVATGRINRPDGGAKVTFECRLEVAIPAFANERVSNYVQAEISAGVVLWEYLGGTAVIRRGTIDFFDHHSTSVGSPAIEYRFEFVSDGVFYKFHGQRRFNTLSPAALITDWSTLYCSVTAGEVTIATGELTSSLDHLLSAYESGAVAEAEVVTPSRDLHIFDQFLSRRLHELYPHLPLDLLKAGATNLDGLSKILTILAEVLLPTTLPSNGPSVQDVVDGIESFLSKASGKQVRIIRLFLQVASVAIPILENHLDKLRAIVRGVFDKEDDSLLRQALVGLHQIVVFAYYGNSNADRLLQYDRPVHLPNRKTDLSVSATVPDRIFDVAIAGTGPGGALLADRLSAMGLSVLLLEAGRYVPERTITTNELDSIARLYKDSALQASTDTSITVLQGRCVGGGGVVNNGIFFPLQSNTLQTWCDAGFPFDAATMWQAYQTIAADLNIGDIGLKASRLNPAGLFLERALGNIQNPPTGVVAPGFYRMMVNLETLVGTGDMLGCRSTGLCNLGCGSERKINSFQYYLSNALTTGRDVVLVPGATVIRVRLASGSAARRVEAFEVRMADGRAALARANSFILCCGPVASSGVLLRSEDLLRVAPKPLIGQRFCGNVASPTFSLAPMPVNQQPYVQMCHVFVPAPPNDGFLLETWFSPPGGVALAMPGFLDSHAARMSEFPYLLGSSPVVGTQPIGSVTLDGHDTVIKLPLAGVDLDRFRRGLLLLVSAMIDGGAPPVIVRFGNGRVINTPADVQMLDKELKALTPSDLHLLPLSTAHPQGGNALSDDEDIGVVGRDFRVRGIDNLRICDGSVFPSAAGVNPQWTIYALAQICAATFN